MQIQKSRTTSGAYSSKFAEHIGVSNNQLLFGVLECIFFSFSRYGGWLAGASGGGILQVTLWTGPLFWLPRKGQKCNPSQAKRSDLQKGGEIEAPRCTRGLKMMAKGSLGQKVLIWGPQNVRKTITKGARRTARSD